MATIFRIATFNLENLDDAPNQTPTLTERIAILRPQLFRLRADVLCLQEVHSQPSPGGPRTLRALDRLLEETDYARFNRATTLDDGQPFAQRNLVILSRFPLSGTRQILHELTPRPAYRRVTAQPQDAAAVEITWERPILYAQVALSDGARLHVLNVHLRSKIPTDIPGQLIGPSVWRTAGGYAEGAFISAMKRVGQALEMRMLIDQLFDADGDALIVSCGDFNGDALEVPLEAIRGDVENTGNVNLIGRLMVPCESSVPESARFSLLHHGRGVMLDHILASRTFMSRYVGTEIHNEILHDESVAFAFDTLFPESDHAPVIAEFLLP